MTDKLELFDLGKGRKIQESALKKLLPDLKTALFFAKVYELQWQSLQQLISLVHDGPVWNALTEGGHSTDLQDYLVSVVPHDVAEHIQADPDATAPENEEILPLLWEEAEVVIANSIQEVANTLVGTLSRLPSKQGQMVFKHLARVNRLRPTVGQYAAAIHHQQVPSVLVILDVSGSMTETTVKGIIEDVLALTWKAEATLAIVSNNTFVWEPGSATIDAVLERAEYQGTHYETLAPLFQKDWGTVITIADYDSAWSAKKVIGEQPGRIGQVFDMSLVPRPTHLAECVGQLADDVTPLLIAGHNSRLVWY